MSRILPATCQGSVVTVAGIAIDGVIILSEGVEASEGILIIQESATYYVASSALDIKEVIEQITDIIVDITTLFTSIGAGMTGPTTAPPGSLAADVLAINTKSETLAALGENLR